jgi:uncharacterized phiE125 gp8 family phage protein
MALILTAGPHVEPVSLSEAKDYLRIDTEAENAVVASLILAARVHIERTLDIALIAQDWSLFLDEWPDDGIVHLPLGPLVAVNAVRLFDWQGQAKVLDPQLYGYDTRGLRARIWPHAGVWPTPGRRISGIEIAVSVGYGARPEDVPQPLRQALLMLVAHWHEEREPVVFDSPAELPLGVRSLLAPYQPVRL